jgi:hypothetical protein
VAVVSCLYGDGAHAGFVPEWAEAIAGLARRPDEVIVAADRPLAEVPTLVGPCRWRHPQAFYLDAAIREARSDWVWVVDIDDVALADGLDGVDDIAEDVAIVGYVDTNGRTHRPPRLTARAYLALATNPYPAGSLVRTHAYTESGGFRDVAFQDWALWRDLAAGGATFHHSDRAHYVYRRHGGSRTALELSTGDRGAFMAEMLGGP